MKAWLLVVSLLALGAAFAPLSSVLDSCRPGTKSEGSVTHPLSCYPEPLQTIGYVEPLSGTRNLSFEIGGVIGRCDCEIGDKVGAGQVLMQLRDESHQAELLVARQQLRLEQADRDHVVSGVHPGRLEMARHDRDASRLKADFLRRELARSDRLLEASAVSQSERDKASVELRVAGAELRKAAAHVRYLEEFVTDEQAALVQQGVNLALARVKLAETQLAKCSLRAPSAGQVLDILRREGESVDEITRPPVIVFGEVSHLRITAEVDEQYVRLLQTGMGATISGRNLQGRSYQGRILLIKPRMGKKTALSDSPQDRSSLHVAEVFIEMEADFSAPVGLLVDVSIAFQIGPEDNVRRDDDVSRHATSL